MTNHRRKKSNKRKLQRANKRYIQKIVEPAEKRLAQSIVRIIDAFNKHFRSLGPRPAGILSIFSPSPVPTLGYMVAEVITDGIDFLKTCNWYVSNLIKTIANDDARALSTQLTDEVFNFFIALGRGFMEETYAPYVNPTIEALRLNDMALLHVAADIAAENEANNVAQCFTKLSKEAFEIARKFLL